MNFIWVYLFDRGEGCRFWINGLLAGFYFLLTSGGVLFFDCNNCCLSGRQKVFR